MSKKKKIIRIAFDPNPEEGEVKMRDLDNDPCVIERNQEAWEFIKNSGLIEHLRKKQEKRNPAK